MRVLFYFASRSQVISTLRSQYRSRPKYFRRTACPFAKEKKKKRTSARYNTSVSFAKTRSLNRRKFTPIGHGPERPAQKANALTTRCPLIIVLRCLESMIGRRDMVGEGQEWCGYRLGGVERTVGKGPRASVGANNLLPIAT